MWLSSAVVTKLWQMTFLDRQNEILTTLYGDGSESEEVLLESSLTETEEPFVADDTATEETATTETTNNE